MARFRLNATITSRHFTSCLIASGSKYHLKNMCWISVRLRIAVFVFWWSSHRTAHSISWARLFLWTTILFMIMMKIESVSLPILIQRNRSFKSPMLHQNTLSMANCDLFQLSPIPKPTISQLPTILVVLHHSGHRLLRRSCSTSLLRSVTEYSGHRSSSVYRMEATPAC